MVVVAAALAMSSQALAQDTQPPDYLQAMQQELARLSLQANCDTSISTCVFTNTSRDGSSSLDVTVRYSGATQTVYIYIGRFLSLEDSAGPSLELSRKLLELNRQMVTSKLEWDRTTNTIRMSVVLNTDSNFDRKAFRSQIKGLLSNARKILPTLETLAGLNGKPAEALHVD